MVWSERWPVPHRSLNILLPRHELLSAKFQSPTPNRRTACAVALVNVHSCIELIFSSANISFNDRSNPVLAKKAPQIVASAAGG